MVIIDLICVMALIGYYSIISAIIISISLFIIDWILDIHTGRRLLKKLWGWVNTD